MLVRGRPAHRLKTYKDKGQEILMREIRAQVMGAESVWREYRFDGRCLVSSSQKSLKDLIVRVRRVDTEGKFLSLTPKKYHRKLAANNCEELKRLLREFCEFMSQFEGRLLNNKLTLSNLYPTSGDKWRLGEWGFACFRETHTIQQLQFQNRLDPVIKSQQEWFVPPEYLAPELLTALLGQ